MPPDIVFHRPDGMDFRNLKDYKNYSMGYYIAFPDLHFTIDDMVIEGDKAAGRFAFSGTHKGKFLGIPSTNMKVTVQGFSIDCFAGGKFVESWGMTAALGLMQQLGVIPMLSRARRETPQAFAGG